MVCSDDAGVQEAAAGCLFNMRPQARAYDSQRWPTKERDKRGNSGTVTRTLIDGFHSDVIKLLSQNSEVLRILIYTRLKISKK